MRSGGDYWIPVSAGMTGYDDRVSGNGWGNKIACDDLGENEKWILI